MWDIGKFKLSLHRGINTVPKFSCTRNAVCVHVICTVVTVHANSWRLSDSNGFTDIIILLAILHELLMSTKQSLLLIQKLMSGFVSQFWDYVFTFCIFFSVRDISWMTELIFSPKNSITCIGVKTLFFQLITKPRCCKKKISVSQTC